MGDGRVITIAARYKVALTEAQRKELTPSCCWDFECGGPTVALRRDSKDGLWYSVCSEHVRMGNTVIIGATRVEELLAA
jgi:hypothetical protein